MPTMRPYHATPAFRPGLCAAYIHTMRPPQQKPVMPSLDVSALPDIAEGDWLGVDYALVEAAAVSGLSQYELLTGLGARFDRIWR